MLPVDRDAEVTVASGEIDPLLTVPALATAGTDAPAALPTAVIATIDARIVHDRRPARSIVPTLRDRPLRTVTVLAKASSRPGPTATSPLGVTRLDAVQLALL